MAAAPVGAAHTVRARRDAPKRRHNVASRLSCVSSPFDPPYENGRIDSAPHDAMASCMRLMLYMQGDVTTARNRIAPGLAIAQRVGDLALVAQAETMTGHIEHAFGNLPAACDHFSRGADAFRTLGVDWGVGSALTGKAGAVLASGDIGEAERLLDEATAKLRHAGPWFLTPVLCFRATLAVQRGKADVAIALIRESLTYIRQLRDKYAFVYALLPLAAAAVIKGDDEWAARIMGARDAVIERTGSTVVVTFVNELQEQAERSVRERLGPDRWAAAYVAGRTMSIDLLLKDIDRVLRTVIGT